MLIFGEKRTVVPDPLPLAYAVYALINVDNCERPLSALHSVASEVTSPGNVDIWAWLKSLCGVLTRKSDIAPPTGEIWLGTIAT